MNFMPILDMGWAILTYLFGLATLAFLIPLTILGEAVFIWLILPLRSIWQAIIDSFVINVISGILGYMVFWELRREFDPFASSPGEPQLFGATYNVPTLEALFALNLFMMGIFCIVSILVEGVILGLLESESSWQRIWLVALLINLISYLALLVIFTLLMSNLAL